MTPSLLTAVSASVTAEQFATQQGLPEFCELVRGRVVEMNVPGFRHGEICSNFAYLLTHHVRQADCGRVTTNDSGIVTTRDPDTVRGADVAYYSFSRLPKGADVKGYPQVVPEFVAEVVSPSDSWGDVLTKVGEYLAAGVDVVAVLDAETSTARVFDAAGGIAMLGKDDSLQLPTLLPGFSVEVAEIFR